MVSTFGIVMLVLGRLLVFGYLDPRGRNSPREPGGGSPTGPPEDYTGFIGVC